MNGNRVQATEARLRCLCPFWRGNVSEDPEDFKHDAAELIRHAHAHRFEDGTPPTAALHPTLLNFFHNALDVKSELQVNPIMTTAGIFLEEADNGTLRSVSPTVPIGALPPDHEHKWAFTVDDSTHAMWSHTAWKRGGITCVRAPEKDDLKHVRRTLHKAQKTTSESGQRVLVVVELPRRKKKKPHEAPPKNLNLVKVTDVLASAVTGKHVLEIPPRYTPWTTNKDWEEDGDGTLTSDPKDGTAAATREGRTLLRANERTLHGILFHRSDDPPSPLSRRQLRELTRILAETATHMPMGKGAPQPRWHEGKTKLELGLSNLAPDCEGFDPRASLRAMVPDGGWQDGRTAPYHDGIAPTYLVEHLRRAGETATAADAQAAYITAGQARDCHQIFSCMLSTTTTNLMKNLGAKPGSLHTPHSDKEPLGTCDCCNKLTSAMWRVPLKDHHSGPVRDAISAIQANRARNICRREMALFPPQAPTPTSHARAEAYQQTHKYVATLRQLAADRGIHFSKAEKQTKKCVALALATQDEEDDGTAQRGPAEVRNKIRALVESTKMKACMSCTLPLQAAYASLQPGHNSDTTTWNTVRRLAQGKDTHSKLKAVLPNERLEPPADIFERGDLGRHTGRDVVWHDDAGHEHSGTIALIARDTEGGDLKAFVTEHITAEGEDQTQEAWSRLSTEELHRAIDTKASRDERHYTALFLAREGEENTHPTSTTTTSSSSSSSSKRRHHHRGRHHQSLCRSGLHAAKAEQRR